jgi:hypothetical protein
MWTWKNVKCFKTDWIDVLCKTDDVQISSSALSHEAHESTHDEHCTMLLWFVKIQDNYDNLNTSENETWSQLIAAHCDLISESTSSSDLVNCYFKVFFHFSAVIHLKEFKFISNALVERKRWNASEVIQDLNVLIKDFHKIAAYI